jgi:hypothetical protein
LGGYCYMRPMSSLLCKPTHSPDFKPRELLVSSGPDDDDEEESEAEPAQAAPSVAKLVTEAACMTAASIREGVAKVGQSLLSQKEFNYTGVSVIFDILPYLDPMTSFYMPPDHALLFGIVPDFVLWVVDKRPHGLTPAHLKKIKQAATHIRTTSDFGRPYRCVVQYR